MRHYVIRIYIVLLMTLSVSINAQSPSTAVNHEYVNKIEHGQAIFKTKSNGIYVFKVSEPRIKNLSVQIPYNDDQIELYKLSAIDWYGNKMINIIDCSAHFPSKVRPSKVVIVGQSAQTLQEIPFEYQDGVVSFNIPRSATYGLIYNQESASVVNKQGINDQYIQASYHEGWVKLAYLLFGGIVIIVLIKYLPHRQEIDKLDI